MCQCRNCSRLEKTKETWQINATHNSNRIFLPVEINGTINKSSLRTRWNTASMLISWFWWLYSDYVGEVLICRKCTLKYPGMIGHQVSSFLSLVEGLRGESILASFLQVCDCFKFFLKWEKILSLQMNLCLKKTVILHIVNLCKGHQTMQNY